MNTFGRNYILMTSGSLRVNNKAWCQESVFLKKCINSVLLVTFYVLFCMDILWIVFAFIFLPSVIYILLDCLCILFLWLGSFSKFHRWIFSFTFKLIYNQHNLRLNFRRFPSIKSYNSYSCLCLLISVSSVVLSWISEFLTMWDLDANIARAWKMLTSKTNRAARYGRTIVL